MEQRPPQIVTSPPPVRRAKSRNQTHLFIVLGILAVLALGLAWAARDLLTGSSANVRPMPVAKPSAPAAAASSQVVEPVTAESALVADDGRTLWASPTEGEPLDLRYLPPGCSLILALRPGELLAHPEGQKVLAALGPRGAEHIAQLEEILGVSLSEVEQLTIGMRVASDRSLDVCLVMRSQEPQEIKATGGKWDEYAPPADDGRASVYARPETLREVQEQGDAPPLLRREMELLVATTDRDRQATLLLAPNFLFADAKIILSGLAEPLREPLFNQLRDELRAVAVSANWGDDFFVEVRAIATSDLTPTQLAAQLVEQIDRWPQQIEDAVLGLTVDPHGRRVVARLPSMTRVLANYTRSGVEEDQAVLRAYLPLAAGHNLLMAAELLLAQRAAGPAAAPGAVAGVPAKPASVEERLQRVTTLRFDRDTLETALRLLSEDAGVEIVLVGSDLQLEGITKNQSFGIDLANQPAETILQEIVRLSNPDKTAASLADERQKLVYVIKSKAAGGEDVIFVTTRSQAAQRGDELPAVFQRPPR